MFYKRYVDLFVTMFVDGTYLVAKCVRKMFYSSGKSQHFLIFFKKKTIDTVTKAYISVLIYIHIFIINIKII